ncbi:MAG: hypothetical protein M1819_002601 [Sarea resinae]|nr:MAG: hypothetical protein M1819_002601 [Sarea resinae]
MEALLSLSFDYLSSYDGGKIRKGLRQIEGLLAQICLARSRTAPHASPDKRSSANVPASPKQLSALKDDPAFREFFKLQEGFEWNVALRLISCLERLLGKGSNGQNDLLIISTLDLTQGILLIHPPSRSLFSREIYMNVQNFFSKSALTNSEIIQLLLDLLDPINPPAIQSHTLLTLVSALLDTPANARTFESLDGLLTVTSLLKQRAETTREVKRKVLEFLYFYLMPEAPTSIAGAKQGRAGAGGGDKHHPAAAATTPTPHLARSPSKLVAMSRTSASASPASAAAKAVVDATGATYDAGNGYGGDGGSVKGTRTTKEKQALLGRYLSNVEDLVGDLGA